MLRKIVLLLLLSFLSIPTFAACAHQNLNDLILAHWGGLWEKGKTTGYFRVLVYRTGWEHSHDVAQVEVMARDEKRKRIRLLHCTQIKKELSAPRIIKSVTIQQVNQTTADVQLFYQTAPFTSAPKSLLYSIDVDGKLSRKR